MILKRRLLPNKYAPFLNYLFAADIDVFFTSTLDHESNLKGWLQRLFDGLELVLWCILNKISLRQVGLIFTKKTLSEKDVLFLMHYGNLAFETEAFSSKGMLLAKQLAELKVFKVVHLTHYAYCPSSGARNLTALKPDLLVAENNLAKNSRYFAKYFQNSLYQFACLPYTPALRFVSNKGFDQRINKLVVTGSITYKMKNHEFIKFFGVNELQPLRRMLYEQADQYLEQMDCLISDLDASRQSQDKQLNSQFLALIHRIFTIQKQKNYYKKNIVEIYNSYAMFAVPEEICDLPAIGFVEGMACGCAYIGTANLMYQDLGMVAGVHYIAYNGTVMDLMSQVHYYQNHPDEIKQIAEAGRQFVSEQLSSEAVYGKFFGNLQSMLGRL